MAATDIVSPVRGPFSAQSNTMPLSSNAVPRSPFAVKAVFLPLATPALLYLAYFPADLAFLGWLALVPWLTLVRGSAPPRRLYLLAWATGVLFFLPVLQWMRVADSRMYATWILLALYCSVYFPLALWLLRWLEQRTRLPLVLTFPVVWTGLEFLRAHLMTGFPWYFLAHTQHDVLPLIQIADLTGAYGVSFLVAAVNALLFEILWQRDWFRRLAGVREEPRLSRFGLLCQALVLGALLLGSLTYGVWQLSQDRQEPGPRLALIQGNMPQGERNRASGPAGVEQGSAVRRSALHFVELSDVAGKYRPDLFVWPETSYPGEWKLIASDHDRQDIPKEWREKEDDWQQEGLAVVKRWPGASLVGANLSVLEAGNRPRRYNTALLVGPDGQVAGHYDKIHRVPFGEYVPLRDWLPFMNYLSPYDFDYEVVAGKGHPALPVGGHNEHNYTFGTVICFEDTDPTIARPYVAGDRPAVDFLVNISNDGWFDGTAEHEQHLAICRFRAVECRRSVARAVNMGVSAVIDANGRVLRPLPLDAFSERLPEMKVWSIAAEKAAWSSLPVREWSQYKKVPGVLLANVPIDSRPSLYARFGDWLPWSCWGLLMLTVVVPGPWSRPKREVSHEAPLSTLSA